MYLIVGLEILITYFKIFIYKLIFFRELKILDFRIRLASFKFYLYKNSKLHLNGKISSRKDFFIMNKGEIILGKNIFFNNSCSINCLDKIEIGNDCLFGENVKIYDHDHKFLFSQKINKQGYKKARIKIGNNCWIGSNVVILKGIEIGDNCVIGAGSIVTKNIEQNTVFYNERLEKRRSIIE